MRIGVLVGKLIDGTFEYLGHPGEVADLDALQRKITDAGGIVKVGKGVKKYVKTWLADVSAAPLKAKKTAGAGSEPENDGE